MGSTPSRVAVPVQGQMQVPVQVPVQGPMIAYNPQRVPVMMTYDELKDAIQTNVKQLIENYEQKKSLLGNEKDLGNTKDNCPYLAVIYQRGLEQFNRDLLLDENFRLGLIPSPKISSSKIEDKKYYCNAIIKHYQNVIKLATTIIDSVNGICLGQAEIIQKNIPKMTAPNSEAQNYAQGQARNLYISVNNIYSRLLEILKILKNANVTNLQLQQFETEVANLTNTTTMACCQDAEKLGIFYYIPVKNNNGEDIGYNNPYIDNKTTEYLPMYTRMNELQAPDNTASKCFDKNGKSNFYIDQYNKFYSRNLNQSDIENGRIYTERKSLQQHQPIQQQQQQLPQPPPLQPLPPLLPSLTNEQLSNLPPLPPPPPYYF